MNLIWPFLRRLKLNFINDTMNKNLTTFMNFLTMKDESDKIFKICYLGIDRLNSNLLLKRCKRDEFSPHY